MGSGENSGGGCESDLSAKSRPRALLAVSSDMMVGARKTGTIGVCDVTLTLALVSVL